MLYLRVCNEALFHSSHWRLLCYCCHYIKSSFYNVGRRHPNWAPAQIHANFSAERCGYESHNSFTALLNNDTHDYSTFAACYFWTRTCAFKADLPSYRWKPLAATQMRPPPVEMRGEKRHLDYISGVSITLEMEVAKGADSSVQQEVQLLRNDSVDSETNPLM